VGSLKISCALWSISAGPTAEKLEEALDTAAEIGVGAVQPWCVDVEKWNLICALDPDRCTGAARREWAERIRRRGLEISGFCAQLAGPSTLGGFGEVEGLQERIRKTQECLKMAVEMGSPVVTTHIGAVPEDRSSELYRRFRDTVRAVADVAEECGGIFAPETGQESAEVLKQLLEDVGSEAVKINYDPANMLRHGTVEGVSVLKDYIVHTHAKDLHPETKKPTVGKGAVPWNEYIAALKAIGYDGWYALEDESGTDVVQSLKEGFRFLERY
jgi:sugar phosphate isomerase/epimerase